MVGAAVVVRESRGRTGRGRGAGRRAAVAGQRRFQHRRRPHHRRPADPGPTAQLPKALRRGRQTLIRTDSGGATHASLSWLIQSARWLSYSVGMTITDVIQAVLKIPKRTWTPAYDAVRRPVTWAAEITNMPDLREVERRQQAAPRSRMREARRA